MEESVGSCHSIVVLADLLAIGSALTASTNYLSRHVADVFFILLYILPLSGWG